MDIDEIKRLLELFAKVEVDALHLKREGFSLKMEKKRGKQSGGVSPEVIAVETVESPPQVVPEDEHLVYVTSPIVGTFYIAPNPKAEAFVEVGDTIREGQTLCIVEAMKLMNEIQSEVSGTIVSCLVENGQPVEYGQNLFAVKSG